MFRLDPITARRWQRFRRLKRGWYSFLVLCLLAVLSLFFELLINNRPLVVVYEGKWFFPTYSGVLPGAGSIIPESTFGGIGQAEADWHALANRFDNERAAAKAAGAPDPGNWLWLPLVPFNPVQIEIRAGRSPAQPPSWADPNFISEVETLSASLARRPRRDQLDRALRDAGLLSAITASIQEQADGSERLLLKGRPEQNTQALAALQKALPRSEFVEVGRTSERVFGHLLGTDTQGRDILARLAYGFRLLLLAAIIFVLSTYVVGITFGCAMGYLGGWFDLLMQRLIEIWSLLPFLYIVIIVSAFVRPNLFSLLAIIVLFSWIGLTYYMRSTVYKEKARDYVNAAIVQGAGPLRIIFRHVLPNTMALLVTFAPFYVAGIISSLSALDFLGFGLPPPTPSWGELLRQGAGNINSPWIVSSAFAAMVSVLLLVTFVGEAVREAFDPKKFTTYR